MEFMNLFTGRKRQGTTSTQNEKIKICYADQPNDKCSSIDKIRKLQDEIESLRKKKGKLDFESAFSVIYNINASDKNIIRKYGYPYLHIEYSKYDKTKELEKCWLDFIKAFELMEDKSKEEVIDYLKKQKELNQTIDNYNRRINNLETQIRLEKEKLGIR